MRCPSGGFWGVVAAHRAFGLRTKRLYRFREVGGNFSSNHKVIKTIERGFIAFQSADFLRRSSLPVIIRSVVKSKGFDAVVVHAAFESRDQLAFDPLPVVALDWCAGVPPWIKAPHNQEGT